MENPKKRVAKMCEYFAKELTAIGLADEAQLRMTSDPLTDLERMMETIVRIQKERNANNWQKSNQVIILDALREMTQVNEDMSRFSKLLHEEEHSLELYKTFRKMYESISQVSNYIYLFESNDQSFLNQKEELITRNIEICNQISKTSSSVEKNKKISKENKDSQSYIASLKREIQNLNRSIEQNDDEFSDQIQKYNNVLYDQQETIREYELRMDKMREYEVVVEDLEHKLIRLKEQKYRDDMLIENMSKKIRMYEKERGGSDIFVSPRHSSYGLGSPSRRMFKSPNSRINQSAATSHARSYMGQKIL